MQPQSPSPNVSSVSLTTDQLGKIKTLYKRLEDVTKIRGKYIHILHFHGSWNLKNIYEILICVLLESLRQEAVKSIEKKDLFGKSCSEIVSENIEKIENFINNLLKLYQNKMDQKIKKYKSNILFFTFWDV